jgi:hypothetical protein
VLAEFPALGEQAYLEDRIRTVKGKLWQQQHNRPTGRN